MAGAPRTLSYEDAYGVTEQTKEAHAPRTLSYEDAYGVEPASRSLGDVASDVGSQLGKGVNTIAGAIPNLLDPSSPVSKFFNDNAQYWQNDQSQITKSLEAAADARIAEAAKTGQWEAFKTAVKEYGAEPALVQKLILENIPSMIPGLAAAKGAQIAAKGSVIAGTVAGAGTNSLLNAGGARQESYQDIKSTLIAQGVPEAEADAQALEKSKVAAGVGAITGALSGGSGLERGILGGAKGGFAKRAGVELGGEQLEEVAPTIATNMQLDRDMLTGVGETSAKTLIASSPGSVISGFQGNSQPVQPTHPGAAQPDIASSSNVDELISATKSSIDVELDNQTNQDLLDEISASNNATSSNAPVDQSYVPQPDTEPRPTINIAPDVAQTPVIEQSQPIDLNVNPVQASQEPQPTEGATNGTTSQYADSILDSGSAASTSSNLSGSTGNSVLRYDATIGTGGLGLPGTVVETDGASGVSANGSNQQNGVDGGINDTQTEFKTDGIKRIQSAQSQMAGTSLAGLQASIELPKDGVNDPGIRNFQLANMAETTSNTLQPVAARNDEFRPFRTEILKFKGEGKTVTGTKTIYDATDRLKAIAEDTGETSLKAQQVWFNSKRKTLEKNGDAEAAALFERIVAQLKERINAAQEPAPVKIDEQVATVASDVTEKMANVVAPKPKRKIGVPKTMSMLQFAASIGGFNRAEIAAEIGQLDDMKVHRSGIFGSPAFRVKGGMSWDRIGEALAEAGYLPKNEHGQYDKNDLNDKISAELGGDKQYRLDDIEANAEADKAARELDELRGEAESIGVDWKQYKTADDLYIAIEAKRLELIDADEALLEDVVADDSADTDFDFGTPVSAAETEAWLNGVDNGQGNQGQANGTATGTQGEGNQRSTERSSAQGEAEQQTPDREFTLTSQTEEDIRQQEERAADTSIADREAADRASEVPLTLAAQSSSNTGSAANQSGMFTPDGRASVAAEQANQSTDDAVAKAKAKLKKAKTAEDIAIAERELRVARQDAVKNFEFAPKSALPAVTAKVTTKDIEPETTRIGHPFAPGEIGITASSRKTTPFPNVDMRTNRSVSKTIKNVNAWLIENAIAEADSRNDNFNLKQFENYNIKNLSQSDKDSAEQYLFGEYQPNVIKPMLNPLAEAKPDPLSQMAASVESLAKSVQTLVDNQNDVSKKPENIDTSKERVKGIDISKNKVFTDDAAAAARAILKKKLGQLNSGLDPEMMQAGITLAGYHIEKGARTFATFARAMIDDLGDAVKPYLKSWYAAIKFDQRAAEFSSSMDSMAEIEAADVNALTGENNVTDEYSGTDLERDSENTNAENGLGEESISNGRGGNVQRGESGIRGTQEEGGAGSSDSLSGRETAPDGERGNLAIYTGATGRGTEDGIAGDSLNQRSNNAGIDGAPIESDAASVTQEVATSGSQLNADKLKQKVADRKEHTSTLENIRLTLPILTEGQQEDVFKAETRFAKEDGYGMLFTNGTGTGKTFTGLGVIKRFFTEGKHNIIIAVPNDKIAGDWQKAGTMLGLDISRLEDTNSAGEGVVITTYANYGQNNQLAHRNWDLIVHDEAHYLAMDKDGTNTLALHALRALSLHPDGVHTRINMIHADLIFALKSAEHTSKMDRMSDDQRNWANADANNKKEEALRAELRVKSDEVKADVTARQGFSRPRALFLSATPFAYVKTVDWANGYLFDYDEGRSKDTSRSYNTGSNANQFFMQHFGYSMRYNKLTQPDAKVDTGLMQRQFNSYLKKNGVLSGRMLDVKADYDRRFVLVDSAVGVQIDAALQWFEEERKANKGNEDKILAIGKVGEVITEKFDYLSRRYLLESIKAKEVLPHVREHLAMGRKVVVFHDYKKGGGFNPFDLSHRNSDDSAAFNEVVDSFRSKFKSLIQSDVWHSSSPITTFQREFPDVLLFNGEISPKQRRANVEKFQDDASGPQVFLVQSQAGKEGISLHDTTGKHQRVLFNLGQPTQPTTAIQQEGRIYRTGQVTDAIFRYLNTGTNWEKWAFATTASRSSAAENLGMGEHARALKDAFIEAFEESDSNRAGMEGEGKGGKERDKAANNALTEYDRARAFYFGTQKKNSRSKSQEGTDYFATPEPVGLTMVQLADIRIGESVLEPSAGHGAIARWMPENAERTAVEPSMSLRPRLAMVFDGKIVDTNFEDLHVSNKYDAIIMNPPFGSAGRTAVDHIAKAATHLRNGGRIVALMPVGSATTKFDKWFYEEDSRPSKPMMDHPKFGKIYEGDTLTFDAFGSDLVSSDLVIGNAVIDKIGEAYYARPKGEAKSSGVNLVALNGVQATGKRTEPFSPAEGLQLVAEIKLPQVTFERAGTAVSTRIIVIEKSGDTKQFVDRDYSDITDINELFDRMENLSIPQRTKAQTDVEPVATQKASKPVVDKVAAKEAADAAGLEIIEHTTSKGKVIRGVVRADLTLNQAKEIDKFTFKKNGGYFIREKHLAANNDDPLFSKSTPTQNTHTVASATSSMLEAHTGKIKAVLQAMLDNGKAKIVTAEQAAGIVGEDAMSSDAQAFYNPADEVTYFVADQIPANYTAEQFKGLVLHEIGVHARELGVGQKEFKSILSQIDLMRKAGNKAVVAAFKRVPKDTRPENVTEEAIAYLLQESPQLGIVQRVLSWFRNAIRAIGKSFPTLQKMKLHDWASKLNESDLRFMAESALKNAERSGVQNESDTPQFSKSDNNILFSKKTNPVTHPFQPENSGKPLDSWIKIFTRNQIVTLYRDSLIGKKLEEYKELRERVMADTNSLFEKADNFLLELRQIPKGLRDAFASLAHDSTLNNVDPSNPKYVPSPDAVKLADYLADNPTNKRLAAKIKKRLNSMEDAHKKLHAEFSALPTKEQDLFKELRSKYTEQMTMVFDEIKKRIGRTKNVDPAIKISSIKKLDEQLADLLGRVYFPLYRAGNYIVKAEKAGEPTTVDHVESNFAADRLEKKLKKLGYTVSRSTRIVSPQDNKSGEALNAVRDLLDKAALKGKIEGAELSQLMDDIDQTILQSLPDQSYRKSFIHRKGTKGYSDDFIRAYADAMRRGSINIANLRHGDKITTVIEDMRKDVKDASKVPGSNVAALNQVVDRVEQIEVDIRNPTSKLVSVSGKIAFAQMLGSLSNFILNITQTPLLTMPHLGAEYGYGKANLQLAMAYAKQMRSLKKQGTLSELGKWLDMRHGLVGNELDLMQQLHDSGFLDLTQSFDLIDAANNPSYQENELSMNVMKVIALPQHVSEIVNRQVTALATIRLEMARSGSPLKAYRAAIKAIDETHFNYSKENRSKLMTGNTQSMLFKFKQYPQQAAFLFVHTAKLALDGSTKLDSDGNKLDGTRPSERTKARKQLAGVLGMQILVAGTLGLPVFAEAAVAASGVAGFKLAGSTGAYVGVAGAIILAAALAFGDDDGEEFDVEVKKWFIKNFGYGIGSSLASGVIPRGLSTRLDASELIIRRPEEKRTPTDTINAWMLSLLGPILGGIVYNAGIGVKEIAEGDIAKGATKLIPVKAIKDLVTSWKWANDGMNVTNKDGEIITPVSKADIFFKSIGINPTSVVNAREYDNAKFTLHNALLKKQQKALKELREETDKTKRFNAIIKYNKSAPLGYEIDSDKVRGVIAREIKYKGKPNVVTGNPVQEDYLNKNTKELRPAY